MQEHTQSELCLEKIMQSNFKKHKSFIQEVSMPGLKEND